MNSSYKRVQIIVVGNEILLGMVLDSNSNWLCKQISGLGGNVERVVIVGDDVAHIAREVRWALDNKADLILTVGGLGPTADDVTVEAVAVATGRQVEPNKEALRLVEGRYKKFYAEGSVDSADLDDARRKMAALPRGAVPLQNNVGAAPGVLLKLRTGQIVASLPGVPAEMKDIFLNALSQTSRELLGTGAFLERTVITDCKDESLMSPTLRQVAAAFRDVYIKSRPRHFGPDVRLEITIALKGESIDEVAARLAEAQSVLEETLRQRGVKIIGLKE